MDWLMKLGSQAWRSWGVRGGEINGPKTGVYTSDGHAQGLVQIREDVVDVLDTDAQANELGSDTSLTLLPLVELRVSGRRGVNSQALGIADIGQVREELQRVDELGPRLPASLDAEDDHGSALATEVFPVEREHGVVFQAGEPHPVHLRVRLQEDRDGPGILTVAFHPQGQGFDALKEHPRVVRRDAGAEVAQRYGPHPQNERKGA